MSGVFWRCRRIGYSSRRTVRHDPAPVSRTRNAIVDRRSPEPGLQESNILRVSPDGPYMLSGRALLAGARSAKTPPTLVLCRCGLSRDKPFCDGTHTRTGFADPGLLPAAAPSGTSMPGEVTITPTPDGPLECRGPLTVMGADGRTAAGEKTLLCRCGFSRTKPFCDGSHERAGFKA